LSVTATNKPYEAYVLPHLSFQQYPLDLSQVFQERALVLARRLAKARAELEEIKSEPIEQAEPGGELFSFLFLFSSKKYVWLRQTSA
jgi:hypothetical protein